ncbi:MAG TPA: hypothetical protein VFT33_03155, partial [Gaiellaceae bacterium]|nr:hypothetical protein [Gaiellaceae bacterium]
MHRQLRRRDVRVETFVALGRAVVGPALDEFDVDENRSSSFRVRDPPETVLASELVAGDGDAVDLRRRDLEITIRIPNLEDLGSHRASPRSLDQLDARRIASTNLASSSSSRGLTALEEVRRKPRAVPAPSPTRGGSSAGDDGAVR